MFAVTSLKKALFSGTAFAGLACVLPGAAFAQVADPQTTTQPANQPSGAETPDEGAAIELVSKDWQGALPFTILFNAQGETIYSKQGKFETDVLVAEIEKF